MRTIFMYLDIIGPLLPLPFFLLKKGRGKAENIILLFLIVQLLLNSAAKYLMFAHINNIIVYQINTVLSFVIASAYFFHIFSNGFAAVYKKFLKLYGLAGFATLLLIIQLENAGFFNSLSYSFTAFSICLFCVLFYLNKLEYINDENIIHTGMFWIISGFFIYYGGSFFIFLTYKIFTKFSKTNFTILWSIHNVILFIFCCLMLIAIKWGKTKTSYQSS